jgi:tRNA dimethylallyltransferase
VEVVALFGPTATGKSAVAELVADALGTEVVSADAMQVYRGVAILTNQPERPTRLVAIRDPGEVMSVGEYAALAHAEVDALVAERGGAVVAGGTGLYLRAAPETGVRGRWEQLYDSLGAAAAHELLSERDPASAALIHANDRRRVVRALELHEAGHALGGPHARRLWSTETRHPTLLVGIDIPQDVLVSRIRERTREMFRRGVKAEVDSLGETSATARHVIGLEDVRALPREEAIAAIELRTRQYAAYQRKWLRRLAPPLVLDGLLPPAANAALVVAASTSAELGG